FHLINGVIIRGGYAGCGEPDPNVRDVESYETVLSGDLAGDDGPDFLNNDENSYHVVTSSDGNETTVLDGFTVAGGHADGGDGYSNGGGMYNSHGSPTLIDCVFRGNMATGEWCMGGGMYNGDGSPTLTHCIFRGNMVADNYCRGGGMCSDSGSPVLTNCVFSGNSADAHSGEGAGMHCSNGCDNPRLQNCMFVGNKTKGSGGGLVNRGLNMTLINCMFIENSARWSGGGLLNQRWEGYVTLTNCMFIGNEAQQTAGGGMFSDHTIQIVTNCTFSGNSARVGGGGIYNRNANWGGYQEITTLTNCILRNNIAESGPEIALSTHEMSISYCNVQGGRLDIGAERYLTWDANSNIDADALFVDSDSNDYHLRWDSPCIDAGDPNGDYAALADIDGEPRVMTGRVDMGADEVGDKQADFTRDGVIDQRDFSVLSQSWPDDMSGQERYVLCDLYEDGLINALDLAEFINDWLWKASWHEP
ncbi:MAG: right-handed parallel beta-helix repeat-containing protein, partial [Planctomycetota bacterium]